MRFILALWNFIMTIVQGIWRFVKGIYRRLLALLEALLGPPAAAFLRVLRSIMEKLDHLLEAFRIAWARIFQRAPKAPKDKRKTPGRHVLLLMGAVMSGLFWYLLPWRDWFELSNRHLELAIYGTALVVALIARAFLRAESRGVVGRFLLKMSPRVGLIWFERLAAVLSFVVLVVSFVWESPLLRPLPLLVFLGFLVLLMSPYEPRVLTDDVPALPELDTEPEGTHFSTHTFQWAVAWGPLTDTFDITVEVDTERFSQMQSTNPVRPADYEFPDFTPWVVSGSTSEVDRTAAAIRGITNSLGYTRFQEAAAVLAFAQSVDYTLDEDTTEHAEYWRYPIETIHEETGDCEDTTILAAAVLRRLGHGVLPLLAPGHAALGVEAPTDVEGEFVVHEGRRYYYCETTAEGFKIGQLPDGIDPTSLRMAPLRDSG